VISVCVNRETTPDGREPGSSSPPSKGRFNVKKFLAVLVLSLFTLGTISSIGCSGDKTKTDKTKTDKTDDKTK
jgi:hypothetical protein